jgi:hypothetical protein
MQLVTFERLLIERLNATGKVQARSFHELEANLLYGVAVRVGGGMVAVRLTKGSGTGDPKMTEAEQAEHDAYVALASAGKASPRTQSAQVRLVEDLMRDVLAADLPPSATEVEGPADGRQQPGVKIRFDTAAEIYMTPLA